MTSPTGPAVTIALPGSWTNCPLRDELEWEPVITAYLHGTVDSSPPDGGIRSLVAERAAQGPFVLHLQQSEHRSAVVVVGWPTPEAGRLEEGEAIPREDGIVALVVELPSPAGSRQRRYALTHPTTQRQLWIDVISFGDDVDGPINATNLIAANASWA